MSFKKFVKKLHLYVALALCLPLILQGLSGATLVFEHEIDDFFLQRKHTFIQGEFHKISEIVDAAEKQVPQGFMPYYIKNPEAKKAAIIVFQKDGKFLDVRVDPVSLTVVRVSDPMTGFFGFLRSFHMDIFTKDGSGRNIVGIWAAAMLFLIITGLILWYPKKDRPFTFRFKFSSIGKKFQRDLHVAVGFWTFAVVFISSFAALCLAYPEWSSEMIFRQKNTPQILEISVPKNSKQESLDEILEAARKEISDQKFSSLIFPSQPNQPFALGFLPKNYHYGEPETIIFIDQYNGKIISKKDARELKTVEKIIAWQLPLHKGAAFGMWWKIMIFFTGFLPLLFSVTGIIMWLFKKLNRFKDANTSSGR